MPRVRVKLNHPGMRELLQSPGVRGLLREEAERVLVVARSSAPVLTGAYRASLRIKEDTTDRAVVRVIATVPYAMVVEARTGHLSKALGAAR